MMNSLLTKFYNNYAIIYVQHSPKPSYIKHYNIICVSHEQLTDIISNLQLLWVFQVLSKLLEQLGLRRL